MPSDNATTLNVDVRPAVPADVPVILRFIRELASYERSLEEVQATEADLLRDGWGLDAEGRAAVASCTPRFYALIAETSAVENRHRQAVGFALYFTTYSTWVGHHGLRLEDLYVTPAYRGQGIGTALLARLARIAVDEGCSRLEWDVLTWNEPAIAVYRRLGATIKDDWHVMRVSGPALQELATRDLPA